MAAVDLTSFPLLKLNAVTNALGEWVALALQAQPAEGDGDAAAALQAAFAEPALLAAIAPLDCIVSVATPALSPDLLALLPPKRVLLAIDGAPGAPGALDALREQGYRIAPTPAPAPLPAAGAPAGPAPAANPKGGDGTSRKRLLALLGLLARDAETRELEMLLKQDPALSYHLLKLVDSAAFTHGAPITSFSQAISLLGRRQLQRWLQLLLYARQQEPGMANPLLQFAALRAAHMEALCTLKGGQRGAQDLAFMTGVFSLLDVLFAIPMSEIVGALNLAPDVADALLERAGPLGQLLRLVETAAPSLQQLASAGLDTSQWWHSQLEAYRWAIQVSRNL